MRKQPTKLAIDFNRLVKMALMDSIDALKILPIQNVRSLIYL